MADFPSRFAALQEADFRRYTIGNLFFQIGKQMMVVAVGWEIYERTGSAMALGYVGLAQLLPVILLTLPAGHVADSWDRKNVVIAAQILMALATLGLFLLSISSGNVMGIYLCLFLAGLGRAFNSPANAALLPQVVSPGNLTNAVTWGSINFQIASITGPALGGLLIAWFHHAGIVYFIDLLCILLFLILLIPLKNRPSNRTPQAMNLQSLSAGIHYIWQSQIILAAITLDLFAILFGGATALLPIYAKDILKVGPAGLGMLQAAPALGAILMALFLTRFANLRQTGRLLLWTVAGFGFATIVFGISHWFSLSFAMLVLLGAFDNISVVIRQALVQLRTPDEMRGRVSAINYMFIGSSNELGGFESGLVAHFWGPVVSVVSGGIGTILVVLAAAKIWPKLRQLDRLEE